MRQVGFKIILDSSGLKSGTTDVKNIINDLRKLETGLKQDGRVDTGISRNVTNLDRMKTSLDKLMPSLQNYVNLMREAVTLSIPRGASGVGGTAVNGGSRVGVNDSPTRVAASAFSGFVRRGESFTSQIGSVISGASRFASIGNLGLGLATFGGAEAVRQAVKIVEITREFSGVSAELAARLSTTRGGVKELTDEAIRLGDSMTFTASEIVGVQIELAKLGFSKESIKQITGDVARFAVVSGGNVADSAKLAGATLRTFEKDASQMEDVVKLLGLSTAKTAIDFESLRQGATQLFSTAASFGLELSETLALLGALKNSGLSDSVAATATRNILLYLANDGSKLRDVLGQLGKDSVKDLDGIVGALKTLDASGIDLAGTFELTDKRSVNAFNTFLRGANELKGLEEAINGTNEEFRIMERERLNSLDGDILLFKSNVDSLALSLGVEGLARAFVIAGTSGIKAFKDLLTGLRELSGANVDANQELKNLLDILADVTITEVERNKVIAELKTLYGDYVKGLDLESITLAEIAELKAKISREDVKKKDAIADQSAFNKLLSEEERLVREIISLKTKEAGLNIQGTGGDQLGRAQRNLSANQRKLGFGIAKLDTETLTTDQFSELQEIANRKDATGALAQQKLKQLDKDIKALGFGQLRPSNKAQALGVVQGGVTKQKSILDKENEEIDKLLETVDKNSIKYVKLIEIQQNNLKLKDDFRTGTVSPIDDGGKKPDEVFLDGSLKFLEKEVSKQQDILDRLPRQSTNYEKQAAALVVAKEKLEIAKKAQEDLLRTTREIAKEEFKQGKEALEIEFRGEKGLVSEIDKKIKTTVLEIEKAKKLGEDTVLLTETLKELNKKYIDAYVVYYKGLKLEEAGVLLNTTVGDNELEAEERILAGENPILVQLEKEIKDSVALDKFLNQKKSDLTKAKEIRKIDLEINKNLSKRAATELEIRLFDIDQVFIANTTGLQSLDTAVRALESGRLDKATQAIDIYQQEVRRFELIRDRDKAIARGDTGKAQELDNDLKLLDLGVVEDKAKNLQRAFLQVADAISQVASALFDLQRINIDNREKEQIAKIDKEYEARLNAAKGNVQEEEKLRADLERRKAAIEKKAAKERQGIAIKEAIIAAALSVVSNLKINPAAAIAAGIIGAIQIATIRKQKFAKGGYYTGPGRKIDETGEYSTGNATLHAGEYVVRRKTVEKYPEVIRALDQDRLRYASGGGYGLNIGNSEARISVSDMDYLVKNLAESVSNSVYSSIMSATSRAYEESTERLKNYRDTRNLSRRENYNLNTY